MLKERAREIRLNKKVWVLKLLVCTIMYKVIENEMEEVVPTEDDGIVDSDREIGVVPAKKRKTNDEKLDKEEKVKSAEANGKFENL